jgi:5-methyltetrahydropteroyltriglutamate--homocysteine methyltransferase
MKQSQDRIITTHVGSLPRPERLESLLIQRDHGKPIDAQEFAREVDGALDYVISKQIESGVDVGNDGEEPRVGFQTYVPQRMSGFSGVSERKMLTDMVRFPKYAKMFTDRTWSADRERPKIFNAPQAVGKVQYEADLKDARFEMTAFRRALDKRAGSKGFLETFVTAASPGIVSTTMLRAENNRAYPTDREYVLDLAREMKKEYDFIVSQGRVSRVSPVQTATRNCMRDEGRPFGVGNQVPISSHRKLPLSKAMVVSVAESPGHDSGRHG